ncbi:hypothetical protein RRG08_020364 [Elysia crispata]|uniref:Thioredoxin domain-containing protein n=1 Tax=Elysia crispata TaxID=231223 RepID=A0AAE0Z9F1_9GAST|nr:hypothetical protein RRG08_020364 [Elysia crispata]
MKVNFGRQIVILLLVAIVSQLCCTSAEEETNEKLVEIDLDSWQEAHAEGRKLLLLLYKTDGCDLCAQALEEFTTILGQPEIPSDVELGKSEDHAVLALLATAKLPAIIFLRDKSYVMYDGEIEVESMLHWIPLAAEMAVKSLGDESFEHLTQASTGATTGDWLVGFSGPTCRDVTSMLDTVGVRFKGKVNVAEVNMAESPGLVQRFQIKQCPHFIYFRQGKMYRYDLPTLDTASLRSFLEGFYKNAKAENVPIPKSQFDHITEGVADFLKEQMKGENRNLVLAGVFGLAISFMIVIFLCCRSILEPPPKQKEE